MVKVKYFCGNCDHKIKNSDVELLEGNEYWAKCKNCGKYLITDGNPKLIIK